MTLRRFIGYRPEVPEHYIEGGYGNAGDQAQYEGVQFTDGTVACRWLTEFRSTSLWASFDEFMAVHGHADYGTRIEWLDEGWDYPEEFEVNDHLAPIDGQTRAKMELERAIDIVARRILSTGERWDLEDWPEIGEPDWDRVTDRMSALTPQPDEAEFREAYDLLTARAAGGEGTVRESDG